MFESMSVSTQETDELDWAPMAVLLTVLVSLGVLVYFMVLAPVPVAVASPAHSKTARAGTGVTQTLASLGIH